MPRPASGVSVYHLELSQQFKTAIISERKLYDIVYCVTVKLLSC